MSSPTTDWFRFLSSNRSVQLVLIAFAVFISWSNCYDAPLVFDDLGSIRDNDSIKKPHTLEKLLNPPSEGGQTVAGRPLLNISFFLNRALSGDDFASYRLANILIHLANAVLLYLLILESCRKPSSDTSTIPQTSTLIAAFITLLWCLHPISTSGVTYLVQRAESLSALFILLCLFAFAKSRDSKQSLLWLALSVVAAISGVCTKETAAVAPLLVVAYHWCFSEKQSRTPPLAPYFLTLFSSWGLAAYLTLSTGNRAGTAELSIGWDSISYLQMQAWAIFHYVRQIAWPMSLVFDYGRNIVPVSPTIWIPLGSLLLVLLGSAIYGLAKRKPTGFLGTSFFLLLAPSSSVFPLTDPVFEHRVYLASACIIALLVIGLFKLLKTKAVLVYLPLAILLAISTHARNEDYLNEETLWIQSLAFSDQNARAHTNLGTYYSQHHEPEKALPHLKRAIEIQATPLRYHNLANTLSLTGNFGEAIFYYTKALEQEPKNLASLLGLAEAYKASGKATDSIRIYQLALEADPKNQYALLGLARAYGSSGKNDDAIQTLKELCQLYPQNASYHFELGDSLARSNLLKDAKIEFQRVLELDPKHAQALGNLGNLFLMEKDYANAKDCYAKSISLQPSAMIHMNLGICYLYTGSRSSAREELEKALQLDPSFRPARELLRKIR